MSSAFYEQIDDDRYASTEHTVGPWSADMQHMGPPSALLTRAIEHCAPRPELALSRIGVEVLGPVPRADLVVTARVLRPGRRIELVGAELSAITPAGQRTVATAQAWRLAVSDTAAVAVDPGAPLTPPEHGAPRDAPPGWVPGYLDALEWRWLRGHLGEQGPGAAWARLLVDVVAGETPTPTQRLLAVADSANGIAAPLDARDWLFLNTDLTVHLHRVPEGDWVGVDARTVVGPTGAGVCSGVLHDHTGPVGTSAQVLTVAPRPPDRG